MELALQVVGLKMTGKIEDAKEIAMRIMGAQDANGGASSSSSSRTTTPQVMNLANNARLMLSRDDYDFEQTIIDALASLDFRSHEEVESSSQPWAGISCALKTGQTLLHLAASRGFSNLVEALIQRDVSLDAQDVNGYTALHFAVIHGSQCCARQIVNAGADLSIVSKMGYTALELAPEDFFAPSRAMTPSASLQIDESDDESHFGDVEEEDSGCERRKRPSKAISSRRRIRQSRSRRSSKPASIALAPEPSDREDPEFDDNATIVSPEPLMPSPGAGLGKEDCGSNLNDVDEKQAAAASFAFANFVQRAWAQFQPRAVKQNLGRNALPIPFPGVPAWAFPVFVPMQAWPPFRNDRRHHGENGEKGSAGHEEDGYNYGWLAQMGQAELEASGKLEDSSATIPVPAPAPVPSKSSSSLLKRFGYPHAKRTTSVPAPVSETEVKAYSYRPRSKSVVKSVKKGSYCLSSTKTLNLISYFLMIF